MSSAAYEAGRAQPQTTAQSSGPFVRLAQPGRGPQYTQPNIPYGGLLNQPLVARSGYARGYRVTVTSVTGGTLTSAVVQPDAPFNIPGQIFLRDSFGTPLITGDGYSIANLIPLLAGGHGLLNGNNSVVNMPSYTALSATTGAGSFSFQLPLEFVKGVGVLPIANASILPQLQMNMSSFAAVFGAGTGTNPTITVQVDVDFYWIPDSAGNTPSGEVTPPGLGTTRQWQVVQANPTVAASTSTRVQLPRLGGYIDNFILIARDSTGARTDGFWPARPQLYVDGVPLIDSTLNEVYDDMAIAYGLGSQISAARPTGVLAFNRKTSLSQVALGLLDTNEVTLSTNPGTLVEFNFAPAGAGSNSPATISALVGQIIPTGSVVYGFPEA